MADQSETAAGPDADAVLSAGAVQRRQVPQALAAAARERPVLLQPELLAQAPVLALPLPEPAQQEPQVLGRVLQRVLEPQAQALQA